MVRQSTAPPAPERDASLVAALSSGDEAAFAELYHRYDAALQRVARAYVANREAAEDVVQETWLGVIRGIDRFEGRSSFKTWLFRILVNRAKTRGVRDSRTLPFPSAPGLDDTGPVVDPARFLGAGHRWAGYWASPVESWRENPEVRTESAPVRALLERTIEELPERQRLVLLMRDVHGLSAEETCDILGVAEGNQRVLLHRARSRVRAVLDVELRAGSRR